MNPRSLLTVACCLVSAIVQAESTTPAKLESPNGQLAFTLQVRKDGENAGQLSYAVTFRGEPLVVPSRLGLRMASGPSLETDFRILKITPSAADLKWKPVWGERAEIRDHYNQWIVELEAGKPARKLQLAVRAYDEGVAFRYGLSAQAGSGKIQIADELTEFRFMSDFPTFATYTAQGTYEKVPLSQIKAECERPLVVELSGGAVAAVGEAALVDFARMRFQPISGGQPGVRALLGSEVVLTASATPWRFVMVGENPSQLLARNDLLLNLNDPSAIKDVSWIHPGTTIRSQLNTEEGLQCVDFAVANGMRFVLFDAGWYGPERDKASDATRVADPVKLDLPKIIAAGKKHNIGVILYVNRIAAEKQLDQILPLYKKWGVAGVKYGFVRVGTQDATAWLHQAVRKAAEQQLMVDAHDEYRMTGYSRTYPNFMSAEGIGGDETHPAARDNVNLAFTRMLAGPADHTFCWMDNRIKNTLAHQLALPVIFFSPWQFLYWYDRPSQIKGAALDYWKNLPTTWDDTRVLDGQIGEHVAIARRAGDQWYLGALNANERRTLTLPLDFLPAGKTFHATIYTDGKPEGGGRTDVAKRTEDVTRETVLKLDCADNGGAALHMVP